MQPQEPGSHQVALLVEGDERVERVLRRKLEPQGWEIVLAGNNNDALERVKLRSFALIVTAGPTSGAEDVELLRKMRRAHAHTRVIIVTDDGTPQDVVDAMKERAFSFFCHKFSEENFERIIDLAMNCPCWDDGIEVASATPDWVNLMVRCDPGTADRVFQFMREIANLPEQESMKAGTAFREMLLNAMEHGGHFDPTEYVEISYVRTRKMVTCRIKDPGQGFSLKELQHSAMANPPSDPLRHAMLRERQGMRPGGYGLLMARNLVDELLYNEAGNEVFLVKYLDGTRPLSASARPSQ